MIIKKTWKTILRSSGIGSFIGVLPAEGGTVASLIGYSEAKKIFKKILKNLAKDL